MIMTYGMTKSFGDTKVLDGVTLDINKGEVIVLIGPSGSGKSTLLRCLIGLEPLDAGSIRVEDGHRMGMVFQDYNLFGHLSVVENVMYAPRKLLGLGRRVALKRAVALLHSVGLASRERALAGELSGGERQRVAIARTLAMQPDILLMDEPTSALDPAMKGEVEAVICELVKKGMTMVIATHDLTFAREIATRCLLVEGGKVYESLSDHTRNFLRRSRMLSETVHSHTFDFYGFLGRLEAYLGRRAASRSRMKVLRLCFEELLLNIIPACTASAQLGIRASGMSHRGPLEVTLTWQGGGEDDPLLSTDEDLLIPIRIVSRYCTHEFGVDGAGVRTLSLVFQGEG